MKKPKVLISYRFTRSDTTGLHCQSALMDILGDENVTFLDPDRFSLAFEQPEADLYLAIDDDGEWIFPQEWEGNKAIWLIDTHTDYIKRIHRAPHFETVFTAQVRGARELAEDKIENVHWLPLGCNPDLHYGVNVPIKYDWVFCGNAPRDRWLPTDRADLLDVLKDKYPNCFAGNAYFEVMMEAYSSSLVIFNRSIIDDMNMRVFEACASGRPLVTNHVEGQDRLFDYNKHLFVYGDGNDSEEDDLLEVMSHCLKNNKQRRQELAKVGREAQKHVNTYHTYEMRMRELLYVTLDYGSMAGQMGFDRNYV